MSGNEKSLKVISIIALILSIIMLCVGFYKINVYEDSIFEPKNAYVGGDAYNYIINGTYFSGYMAIGGALLIVSAVCFGFSKVIQTVDSQSYGIRQEMGRTTLSTEHVGISDSKLNLDKIAGNSDSSKVWACKKCGDINPTNSRTCKGCGADR